MNYTKGEWKVKQLPLTREPAIYVGNKLIAGGVEEANAHLIAAAPEMYEALKELMDRFNGGTRFPLQSTCDRANQVIAKIEGGK